MGPPRPSSLPGPWAATRSWFLPVQVVRGCLQADRLAVGWLHLDRQLVGRLVGRLVLGRLVLGRFVFGWLFGLLLGWFLRLLVVWLLGLLVVGLVLSSCSPNPFCP